MSDRNVNAAPGSRIPMRRSALVVGLVVALGALGTGLSAFALHASAQSWSEHAFEQKQEVIGKVVMAELIQYGMALIDLSASMSAQAELTADSFATITAPINGQRLPGAVEVEYVVRVTATTVRRVQADWRRRGSSGLTLNLASAGAAEHYVPVLGRTLDRGPSGVGSEVVQPAEIEALRATRSAGGVTTSSTYPRDDATDRSFIMAAAVNATPSPGAGVRGWVTMTFNARDFLGPAVGIIAGDQVGVEFADVSRSDPVTIVTWQPDARTDTAIAPRTIELPFPAGQWRLTVRPTVRLLPQTEAWLARGAAAIGSVLTLLLAALTATVVTSRDRALRRVDQATADLRDDIERREAVEQRLRRREEELVGFAGVVAHDLRSPLASVLGFAELIAAHDNGNMTDRQRGHLTRVRTGAARMQHLIDDLLAYATADNSTLNITEIDLGSLVDDILAERLGTATAGTATAGTATVSRAELPVALGDPSQIRQVLDNLIGNAIKYTPADRPTEITISATGAPGTEPDICRIEVADRGIGIPEKQLGEIFNAFTRAEGSESYPGTGLGLAIVQRIVERHGGAVGAVPNPDGGTRFWFTVRTAGGARRPHAEASSRRERED